jgi:tetratricopeptide (TPR) repeat protein
MPFLMAQNHPAVSASPALNMPMTRRERRAAGRGSYAPAALYKAGLRHLRAGRHLDAQTCCQQALEANSDHADTLHLMGLLSLHAEQYELAVERVARAIKQDPKPEYLSTLGTALRRHGRLDEALMAFDKAVQLKPDDAELWTNLGDVLLELKRPADSVVTFQHVLKLNPQHWEAANRSGRLLCSLKRWAEALVQFNLCDKLQPNHAPTLQIRSICLRQLRRFEDYLADSRRAYALDPTNAETCNHIGDALQSLGRAEEALQWFDRSLGFSPDSVMVLNNKAFSLSQIRRFDEAVATYDLAKAIDPGNAVADWNLALLHLLIGNFEAGWAGREARWKATSLAAIYPKFAQPVWLGDGPIEGKTILIHEDEGLGDTIQFARYLPMLAARGARVILVVQEALCSLLSGLPGVSQCLPISASPLPPFDVHCPMSSLPLAFRTRINTIPAATSYLPASAKGRVEAWEERLGSHDRLRVGLVWSGSVGHKDDQNRSIPLRAMSGILDLDATFVSLQKDPRAADKAFLLERTDIVDMTAHLTDFSETAALVSSLDLVITVDTSVAHLAGALGRPTWILLPYTPDYRWLLDRDDSPWYPTVRLFRQGGERDYAPVLDRLRDALRARIAAFRDIRDQREPGAARLEAIEVPDTEDASGNSFYRALGNFRRHGVEPMDRELRAV